MYQKIRNRTIFSQMFGDSRDYKRVVAWKAIRRVTACAPFVDGDKPCDGKLRQWVHELRMFTKNTKIPVLTRKTTTDISDSGLE